RRATRSRSSATPTTAPAIRSRFRDGLRPAVRIRTAGRRSTKERAAQAARFRWRPRLRLHVRAVRLARSMALAVSDDALVLAHELGGDVSAFGTVFTLRHAVILDDAGRHDEARPLFDKVLADSLAVDGRDSGEHLEARVQFAR